MTDFLLEDVKALLLKDLGDPQILKRIQRACERNEVISVYERGYVEKLAEQHLRKKPKTPTKPRELTPEPSSSSQIIESTPQQPTPMKLPLKTTISSTKFFETKNTKVMMGLGAIALAIIIIVAVSQSGISTLSSQPDEETIEKPIPASGLLVETDTASYNEGDLISISGISDISIEKFVELSIKNNNDELIWAEEVKIKSNGEYSTLAIAGGEGWEETGNYILKAEHGTIAEEVLFNFRG